MQDNNTTAECLVDCLEETSGLLDELEVILVAIAALLGIAAWAMKKYKELNADGKITLDEVIDSMGEVKEKVAEAKEEVEKIEKTLDSHNVAELKAMLKEAGLSVSGKKADLVARLEAYKEGQ